MKRINNADVVEHDFRYTDFPFEIYAEKVIDFQAQTGYDYKKKVEIINERLVCARGLNGPLLKLGEKLTAPALEVFKRESMRFEWL